MPITLGEQIRGFREEAGMTMGQAARRAGISSGHWSNIEGDRVRQPSIYVIAKMAKAIDAQLDELMHGVELPAPMDAGWEARRAREGDARRKTDGWAKRRKQFRTRDMAEAFGRSAANHHVRRMLDEGKIEPLDPDLPMTSPNWVYRWVRKRPEK